MKFSLVGALASACFALSQTHAGPVILSSSLNLDAQGNAGASPSYGGGSQSYSNSQTTSLPLGAYHGSASGVADWSIPNQPIFQFPPNAHAESSASATTGLGVSSGNLGLSLTGNLSSTTSLFIGSPAMYESSASSATLDFQFTLDRASAFSLTFDFVSIHASATTFSIIAPEFSFSSATQGTLLGFSNLVQTGSGLSLQWNYSGFTTLGPGTYTLHANFSTTAGQHPLGDFGTGIYSVNLSATTIPDHGSVALLLAPIFALLAGLAATRRRTSR
jgi:hypothetical protein